LYITPTHLNISFHVHSHHYNLHHFPTRRSSDLYWVTNEKDKVLQLTKKVEQAIQEANIPLTVSPSQEIRMNEEFSEELFAENYLPLDKSGQYYLVEFSWSDFPSFFRSYL